MIAIAVTDLGGEQDKCNVQIVHTTSFNIEVKALTYIMIFNFYPVKNLTTFSQPRALFLHVLLKGKEIDICAQLYHLLTKRVRKRKSWMTLPLAAMIMKIFLTHSVDLPSSWAPIKGEDPISAVTMTRSRACLPSAKSSQRGRSLKLKSLRLLVAIIMTRLISSFLKEMTFFLLHLIHNIRLQIALIKFLQEWTTTKVH